MSASTSGPPCNINCLDHTVLFDTRVGDKVTTSMSKPELASAPTSLFGVSGSAAPALVDTRGNCKLAAALLIVVTPMRSAMVGVRKASMAPGTSVATNPAPGSPEPAWKLSAVRNNALPGIPIWPDMLRPRDCISRDASCAHSASAPSKALPKLAACTARLKEKLRLILLISFTSVTVVPPIWA